MSRYRKLIKFIATFCTTVYLIFLFKVFSGDVVLAGPMIDRLNTVIPMNIKNVDTFLYLAVLPLILVWVLVARVTHLSEEERIIADIRTARAARGKGGRN